MNLFWRISTKFFAFFILIFANFIFINAQEPDSRSIYELPAGTKISVRMDNEINSRVSGKDDTFTAEISKPVIVRNFVVVPIGTVIEGRVIKANRAASGGKDGNLSISFETMRFRNGVKREIAGILTNQLKAESSNASKILAIVGGTALGGIIGAVSKADNGALIGAGLGAGAGAGVAFLQKGRDVRIKADEEFEIELIKDVTLPVPDN